METERQMNSKIIQIFEMHRLLRAVKHIDLLPISLKKRESKGVPKYDLWDRDICCDVDVIV